MYNEYYLINRYFNRLNTFDSNIEIGIGDDCALLNIPSKKTLAISTDTLVCGQNFLPDINPDDLAYKALAVNISDIAAMGAEPIWLTLALTLPEVNEPWLKVFSDTLFDQLEYYGMQMIGGDTTFGPLSITLAIYGFIPPGCALKRLSAKPGDFIYVTGTLGDSAAGLAILQKKLTINNNNDASFLIKRHLRPTPRIFQGKAIRYCANAATDLSDGLVSDLTSVLKASNVGAYINLNAIPISEAMLRNVKPEQALNWAISGGEDYELCFTVSENNINTLNNKLSDSSVQFTCIGQIVSSKENNIQFIQNDKPIELNCKGYDHFSKNLF